MRFARRDVVLSTFALLMPKVIFAQPATSGTPWLEVMKLLGDIGDSFDKLAAAADRITVRAVHRYDWFRGRNTKDVLTSLSQKLTALLADQQSVQLALDTYGDTWRDAHNGGLSPSDRQQSTLRSQWQYAVRTIRAIAETTRGMLEEVRHVKADIALSAAYKDLQNALVAKAGVLDRMADSDPPDNPDQLRRLVGQEETFMHLRAGANRALESLNRAIERISPSSG